MIELYALADMSANDLFQLYGDVLTGLLDKHCPVVKMRRTPWFYADCRAVRRHTRAAERRFRRSHSSANKLVWDRKMKSMRSLYNDKHVGYLRNEISVNKGNIQGLWRTLDPRCILGDSARDDASPYSAEKRDSCSDCSSGWHAIFCIIRTTVCYYFNRLGASHESLGDSWASC